MTKDDGRETAQAAKQRVEAGLETLRTGLAPYVVRHMEQRYGPDWQRFASRARGADAGSGLDIYALLKTLLDNWNNHFRHDDTLRKARSFISLAMDARNAVAHFSGDLKPREALRHLDALREIAVAVDATRQVQTLERFYEEQRASGTERSDTGIPMLDLDEPDAPHQLRPWREVCEPHSDVLDTRFSDAEFAADLAQVDRGEGSEEYLDPAAFFRMTYVTEGLRRVLTSALSRLAGTGGDPVIGLQTNFGGGKTHTMLALYHLAGAVDEGYRPEELTGLEPIFEAAGVETLGRVNRAVFSGTHKGPAETMHTGDGREIRSLWGYIAWRLGGWPAFETIASSEAARTNPGSERLIPILREAAPCLILMDEVVAFARQLRGLEYDAFHAFIQSITEAAAAVESAVVIGSLPESGAEVGDEKGRDALQRLQKLFGRVQSAWTPASGIETYEIVRQRLFQPLDSAGEKARNETVRAFRQFYRNHKADFPAGVHEAAYEDAMRRAYPLHPDVLRRFSGDWSMLENFQKTRNILKIMANVVYALWSGESTAPLIMPAQLPFREDKVRTALLEPLDRAFGPILLSEVDGDQSLSARIEAERPRLARTRAVRSAARAVFFGTAPHAGASRGGMSGTEIRLACAQPGDQIGIFGEALEQVALRSAHLYRDGDSYWFSPLPTLNKLVSDRARDISEDEADQRIIGMLRDDQRSREGFQRVHVAPDNPTDIEDQRAVALIVLPPSKVHDRGAGSTSPAAMEAADVLQRRGSGQRRYRNALVFVAADATAVAVARDVSKRELAWRSILADVDTVANLTNAQTRDATTQADRSREALQQGIRGTWVHVLYPEKPEATDGGEGFVVKSTRLTNRGGAKRIVDAVWAKATSDGTVLDTLGPGNLVNELQKLWPDDETHLSIASVRDWFATFVYLPRLRDDATLKEALEKLCGDATYPYAYAAGVDAEGVYQGVRKQDAWLPDNYGDGLLVRRDAIQSEDPPSETLEDDDDGPLAPPTPLTPPEEIRQQPTRFWAQIDIDPDRAGLEVARIMDGLLAELTRPKGSSLKIVLDLEGTAPGEGFPDDVVETVKANARDLKLDEGSFGFEE